MSYKLPINILKLEQAAKQIELDRLRRKLDELDTAHDETMEIYEEAREKLCDRIDEADGELLQLEESIDILVVEQDD